MGAPSIFLITITAIALLSSLADAHDPSPLQDFCVAIRIATPPVFMNGKTCKNPNTVNVNDFFLSGFNIPGNTANPLGSNVTRITADNLPGLNTLGVSLARVDLAVNGLNPPHFHPRATEVLVVLRGTIRVGFVASNPTSSNMKNRFFTKVLVVGDVFVIPEGQIHFEINVGKTSAFTIQGFSSQNPGTTTIANAVFGSNPIISTDVLTKAFQVDKKIINALEAQFS